MDLQNEPLPPPPPRHVEFKAGMLLALVLMLVCAAAGYLLYARGVFEETQELRLMAEDSEGVTVGMDLTFAGFPVGRVRRIELADDARVRIVVAVATKDAAWLRSTSIYTLERGLVGDAKLRAFTGVLTDPPLPPDAERPVLRGDVSAEIPRLVATMQALVGNVERMTQEGSDIDTSLGNVRSLSEGFKGRYGVLGATLGGDDNAKKLIAALDRANALLGRTDALVGKADQRLFGKKGVVDDTQALVRQLNALLTDAQGSLKKLDSVLVEAQAVGANARVATQDLAPLRAEVESSLRRVDALLGEVHRKWPFARETDIKLP
ncbi:MlaD family protein [Pseudorhodoferax sp. Leaf267]|uniref:MlaD family protein n=1 Tax=Pseudorhodoferax sp. Leaf267 TaxID=1736316 RepID=UPI0006F52AA5|nr:MlaD family protein [Pseudorhodoferax sp. Leaf267]KQP12756.1 mammalian cell entry protein [Pseudorhodoferax sp. Leaf267]